MPDAELEISVRRRESGYTADARFWSPAHDVLPATDVPLRLDLAALRAHRLDPVGYGRVLTTALFADPRLRAAWQQARAVAQQQGALRLRIRLDANDPDLHALAWETLHDPEDDTPLALNERIRLSRYLEGGDFSSLTIPARPTLRALVVVANPSDLARYSLAAVDVKREVASARAALGDIPTTVVAGESRATLAALTSALRDGPHLVILVCHGSLVGGQPYLWLERDDGTADRVAGEAFIQSVAQLTSRPLLLMLASCQSAGHGYGDTLSALAPRLAQAGVPGVLAFQGNVGMNTVRRLFPALITELRRDGSIDRALAAARGFLRQEPDWWLAVLTLRVRDGQLWRREASSSSIEQAYQVQGLPNPYLGLRPFTYAEHDRFAGRERLIQAALAQLTTPGEERTLLFVTGTSGSGKSSFVQAGLLPALEAYYTSRALTLRHAVMRPSKQPLAALADALRQLGIAADGAFATAAPFTLGGSVIEQPDVVVLVIDQFEELFTQSEPAQHDTLLDLLAALPPFREVRVHILCTLRSDFLGELAERRALEPVFREQVLLRGMDEDELSEAMQRPLRESHPEKRIEPALLKRLVVDVADEASYLPLLQVTLEDLWRRGSLTLGAYTSLTDAIRERAEQVYAFQDYDGGRQRPRGDAEKAAILGLLLDLVEVSLDDESRRDVRRRRSLAELTRGEVERTRLVVDLASARLLSTSTEQRDGTEVEVVDIIHESLIANWDRFKMAITGQREALQRRARFEGALREWVWRGTIDDYLLDGGRLADAQLLAEAGDVALSDAQARNFLTRSLAKRDEVRHRQLKRVQLVAAVLGVLLVIAVGAGAWAVNQTGIALQEADQRATAEAQAFGAAAQAQTAEAQVEARLRISNAQRLAFAAQALPLEPALQLAYEAYALDQNSIAELVLHDLVNRQPWKVTSLTDHTNTVSSTVFASDGTHILAIFSDGTARLWNQDGTPLATLTGHTDSVRSGVFSPDGTRILTASFDRTARLWDQDGNLLATLKGYADAVWSAVFSPDGTRILTASWDNSARLWNQDGTPLATLTGHTDEVWSAIFSPDRTRILTTSADGTARLWNQDGIPLATLQGHTAEVSSAVFSPDGTRILTASADGTARLWDQDGAPLVTLEGHTDSVRSAVFSPDGTRILTASWDNTARLWDQDGNLLATLEDDTYLINSAVFAPDGSRILTISSGATATSYVTAHLWDQDGRLLAVLEGHTGSVNSAVFAPDGAHILTASYDGTARLWDRNGKPFATLEVYTGSVDSAVFAPGGARILTISRNTNILTTYNTARLWDKGGQPLTTLEVDKGLVRSAVFSPDGAHILTASYDGTARLWDRDGALLATLEGHTSFFRSAVFSPDGIRILTASDDGTARLWSQDGQPLTTLQNHTASVFSAVFSPDGTRILTASADGTARLWDQDGQPLTTLMGHTGFVISAVFSPDGTRILTASADGTARLWNQEGIHLATLKSDTFLVSSAVFSPDGTRILTASADGTARLWNQDGAPLATLQGHTDSVWSAVFSPDGMRILTASWDNTARLWNQDGTPLATLQGHTDKVWSAVFSPDGTRILTASADGTARQYFVNPSDLLAVTACRIARPLTKEEIAQYDVPMPLQLNLAERHCPSPAPSTP